jgi:hypothetical protein
MEYKMEDDIQGFRTYAEKILPEGYAPLLDGDIKILYSSIPISHLPADKFKYSADLLLSLTENELVKAMRDNFAGFVLLIEDCNDAVRESSVFRADQTKYYAASFKQSDKEIITLIRNCESWRSFGLIIDAEKSHIGLFIGAFDLEGYVLLTLPSMRKSHIEKFYSRFVLEEF